MEDKPPLPSETLDSDLVRQAKSSPDGDSRAFEQLVRQHQRQVVANCRYITRDPSNAEDLAQEVFVKAYFALNRFEEKSSFSHWLRRIKVNHCLNHLRKQEGKTHVALEEEALPTQSDNLSNTLSDRDRIARTLEALPDTLRVPLILRDLDDLSYEEIAANLNIGLSAAKMRVKRAREEFRRLYEPGATA